jgi:hypothetical protein
MDKFRESLTRCSRCRKLSPLNPGLRDDRDRDDRDRDDRDRDDRDDRNDDHRMNTGHPIEKLFCSSQIFSRELPLSRREVPIPSNKDLTVVADARQPLLSPIIARCPARVA